MDNKNKNKAPTVFYSRICLRGIQRKLQRIVFGDIPKARHRPGTSIIPYIQRVRRLREWHPRVPSLICPDIPYDLRRRPRNNTVRGSYRVCVSVLAYRRDSEVRRGGDHRRHAPAKGDELARGDFVEGRRFLFGLRYDDPPKAGCGGNRNETEAG